ncbi:MAG: branched-chain amino acid ABC transporter permease [Oscillospiraceae bacterium]|nr:branched-chain amino acid ABC transporter permease [Oscillospiraceae bacterium]MBQ5711348.1 branched-chain amino acid ABC transporter permease [Oscillospiraceae bacterium]
MTLKKLKLRHYLNYMVIGTVTAVLAGMVLTGYKFDNSLLFLLEKIAISIILAVSLSLVVGFLGELSLGHAGFMCVGAYLGGKIAALLVPTLGNGPLTFLIALLAGGGAAAVCGIIIGIPALRLRGDYLAIVTLAFGEIVKSLFQNSSDETFGGSLGLNTPRYDKNYLFIFAFVLVLLTLMVVQNLMRSKHGRAITAIRDNEIAARATGTNVTKYKLLAFTLSAAFAGIAGVLYSYSNYTVQSMKFGYNYSIEILVMVVLGGMGSINGSIIAAALITFLNTKLATILTGDLAVLQNLFYALILIAIVIYNNAPALKGFRDKYNLSAFADKIRKSRNDPGHVKDDKAKWDVVPTKIEMNEILSVDLTPQDSSVTWEKGGPK